MSPGWKAHLRISTLTMPYDTPIFFKPRIFPFEACSHALQRDRYVVLLFPI